MGKNGLSWSLWILASVCLCGWSLVSCGVGPRQANRVESARPPISWSASDRLAASLQSSAGVDQSEYRKAVKPEAWGLRKVTIDSQGDPFPAVALSLGADAGVSVVLPPGITDGVSLSLIDIPAEQGFKRLASAMGLAVDYAGGVVTFSKGRGPVRSAVVVPLG